ncbi:MAG TPA: DUF2723 domain-containing protein [Gemmatimonadales bacterium]
MSAGGQQRLEFRVALFVFAVVLGGYLWTLAPSVTFWDAGELIAATKILGVPHPPGTPLFVLIGHVWGTLVPLGEFAFRTNLMTAIFSAGAATLFFLLVAQALRGGPEHARDDGEVDRTFVLGGAAAAAVMSAFAFTVWQNSNETEVYMVATLSIAGVSWLAWLWRRARGTERAAHILLLIVYVAALSIGNHLLTLLVGPALLGFMWHVLRSAPLASEQDRRVEWGQWLVVTAVWVLLIGVGLGKVPMIVGGLLFLVATAYALSVGAGTFALTVLAIAFVGASTYFFLFLRAHAGPMINEADPSTWENLLSVVWREQYPPRSPIDNPIYTTRDTDAIERIGAFITCLPRFVDGPVPSRESMIGIPPCYTVRSIPLMLRQIQNYLQYFDWQWSSGLAPTQPVFAAVRLPITVAFISLGVYGGAVLKRRDASVFWLLVLLFLITGPGLVGYMNFKPGFSLAWDKFPTISMHEVRERDYFFTVSFQVWGLLVGIGAAGLYRMLRARAVPLAASRAVFAVAAIPFVLNWNAASRRHGPDALLARDFAYDLLQSAEPYGIIFTNGDNDTFPLWYLQEVEEVRQDVAVVNLSLGNTDWYLRQLRDNPPRAFDPAQAPWYADGAPAMPTAPLHSMTDEQIGGLTARLLQRPLAVRFGEVSIDLPANTPLYVKDFLVLRLIQENWNRRPIYFSMTAGSDNWLGTAPYLTQQGLTFRLHADAPPDSSRLAPGLFGVPMDLPRTDSLVWHVFRYADLLSQDTLTLDPTSRNIAINLSYPFYALGNVYELTGDRTRAIENLRRGHLLQPNQQMLDLLRSLENSLAPAPDTVIP